MHKQKVLQSVDKLHLDADVAACVIAHIVMSAIQVVIKVIQNIFIGNMIIA